MSLPQLTDLERDVIGACLRAAADGPFFPDAEFHTLFGLEREEVRAIAAKWPQVSEAGDAVPLAINNSLGNLLGYPHDQGGELQRWAGATYEEIESVFRKWRGDGHGHPHGSSSSHTV
jgi:hypothetical protein